MQELVVRCSCGGAAITFHVYWCVLASWSCLQEALYKRRSLLLFGDVIDDRSTRPHACCLNAPQRLDSL